MKFYLLAASVLACASVSAALLVSESFNYASGTLDGQGGWFVPSGGPTTSVTNPSSVASFNVTSIGLTGASVPGGVSGGAMEGDTSLARYKNALSWDSTGLPVTGQTFWYSYLVRQEISSTSAAMDFRFLTTADQPSPTVPDPASGGVGTRTTVANLARPLIGNTGFGTLQGGASVGTAAGIMQPNQTYFVVGKAVLGTGPFNPTSGNDGGFNSSGMVWVFNASTVLDNSSEANLTANVITFGAIKGITVVGPNLDSIEASVDNILYIGSGLNAALTTTGKTTMDEFRIGTSLPDVVGVVPEPSTYALIIGGFIAVFSMIRRRK